MGCAQFSKQTRSKNPSSQKTNLECSIQIEEQRYNPDFMKKGCKMSDLNDYSLVVVENKKKAQIEIDLQDDFKDNSQDEKNTISSKSEKNKKSSKPVIPAQMQQNWQLKNNICVSSLLQRRSICQPKTNSNSQIQQE